MEDKGYRPFNDIPEGTRLLWKDPTDHCDFEKIDGKFEVINSRNYKENGYRTIFDPATDGRWKFEYPKERLFDSLYERMV